MQGYFLRFEMKYSKWKEDYFTAAILLILLPARVFTNVIAKKGWSLLEVKGLSLCTRKGLVFPYIPYNNQVIKSALCITKLRGHMYKTYKMRFCSDQNPILIPLYHWQKVKHTVTHQGAKKIIFTACHSGKLKLAFTSPDVISTSPKNFLTSRIDSTVLLLFEFLKKYHLPVGQVKNRIY